MSNTPIFNYTAHKSMWEYVVEELEKDYAQDINDIKLSWINLQDDPNCKYFCFACVYDTQFDDDCSACPLDFIKCARKGSPWEIISGKLYPSTKEEILQAAKDILNAKVKPEVEVI